MDYNIAKIKDKIKLHEKTGKVMNTNFLTPLEINEALSLLRGIEYIVNGGFDEAERKILIIGSADVEISDFCKVLRIESYNSSLSHRDVLGSILGLGIKREMIGDIIVKNEICDIIVMRDMAEYLLNNFNKVGKEKINIKEIDFDNILRLDDNKKIMVCTAASLRLDVLVSTAFGISREKSLALIKQERVMINHLVSTNASKVIKENELISVRGYGRIKLVEVIGESKKGRIKIGIEVYK